MNERIKQLMEQAQVYADQQWLEAGYPSWENYQEVFAEDYNKKFAELIVREMCQVINDDCELQMRQRIITNLGGLNQARELIKQHFGVEE